MQAGDETSQLLDDREPWKRRELLRRKASGEEVCRLMTQKRCPPSCPMYAQTISCSCGQPGDAEGWRIKNGPEAREAEIIEQESTYVALLVDRDRLRSELDAARAELARARLAYIRQIERRAAKHCAEWAQVIRWSMGCWDPTSYQGRRLTRIRKVRDACRAELARMGTP